MEQRAIRTAVVGVGHQGRRHADKLAALPGAMLVAVADADRERANAAARDLGVAACGDLGDLAGRIDAAIVATPTPTHFAVVGALLRQGVHVLVEKPIAASVDEASALVELADARGLVFQVGHLERFNPAVAAVAGRVREPLFIESNRIAPYKPRGLDVSVVLDLMIHDIDLIHSFVPSPMVNVDAIGGSVFSGNVDIANARIRFASGCVANVTSSRISFKTERSLRIFQADSYLHVDMHANAFAHYAKASAGPVAGPDDLAIDRQSFDNVDAMLEQARAFVAAVAGGPPPRVSGRTALEALRTATVIGEQAARLS